jgi:TP901 family phage tail tape measure protein
VANRVVQVSLIANTAGYTAGMKAAAASTAAVGTSAKAAQAPVWAMQGGMNKAAGGASMLTKYLGPAMLAGAMKSSVTAAMDFESSVAKMGTQVGLSAAEVDTLGGAAMNLGHTGRGPRELADAMFFVTSAGLRGADAVDVLEMSAKAAAIGLGETATIADLVTSAVNAYGSEALSASDATDVLVGTVRAGKAEASELAGAMGGVLPIASEMGVSLDQVGAAMAAMTRTGTDAATSATQLRAIMVTLMKPTKDSQEALAEFGLSAAGLRQTIQEDGLFAALMLIKQAVGDNEEAMARIFPNVRALAGVLDLTGANASETAAIFEDLTNVTGATDEAFERWGETTEASMARAKAAVEGVKIELGTQLLPVVGQVAEKFTWLLTETDAVAIGLGMFGLSSLAASRDLGELEETGQAVGGSFELLEDATNNVQASLGHLPAVIDPLGNSLNLAAEASAAAEESLTSYLDAAAAAADPILKLKKAVDDVTDANKTYKTTMKDAEASTRDKQDAAWALIEAELKLESAALAAEGAVGGFSGTLQGWVRDGKLTESQAKLIADSFVDVEAQGSRAAKPYHMSVHLDNFREVTSQLDGVERRAIAASQNRSFTISAKLQFSNTSSYNAAMGRVAAGKPIHDGGYITTTGPVQRYHAGGLVAGGLAADEVPAILQTGEVVLSRTQVGALSSALHNIPRMHGGGTATATRTAAPTTVVFDIPSGATRGRLIVEDINAAANSGVKINPRLVS